MHPKIISFLIVLFSLFSGIIGSYIYLNFINPKLVVTYIPKTHVINRDIKTENTNVSISNIESEITKIVKEKGNSAVSIIIKKYINDYRRDPSGFFWEKVGNVEKQVGGGTGFFVTKDGLVLTNKHVVFDPKAKYVIMTKDGKEYDSTVLALDQLTDLAVLKIDKPDKEFNYMDIIEEQSEINIGQFVLAIGNALGEFQDSVSFGVISGKNRSIEASGAGIAKEKLFGLLQTDAAINLGNSGGPLINLKGEVVGINTAVAGEGQGIGFTIPLTKKRINYIIHSIEKNGKINRPYIGIIYEPITTQLAKSKGININYGAIVSDSLDSIIPGSNAEKAGLKAGDIILEVDGTKVTIDTPIASILQNNIPGDFISLKVLKENGKIEELKLELGEFLEENNNF